MNNMKKLCGYLYGIYAAGMIMQAFTLSTALIGSTALIVAIVIAYNKQAAAQGTIFETHFQWLIRTFWIGGGVYLPVATILGAVILFYGIDFDKMTQSLLSQEISDPMQLEKNLMDEYGPLIITTLLVTFGPFIVWWLWRCWKGWQALKAGKPIDNVMSWA